MKVSWTNKLFKQLDQVVIVMFAICASLEMTQLESELLDNLVVLELMVPSKYDKVLMATQHGDGVFSE